MRVVVLDPSCINWFYTHRLCGALVGQGCEVHVVASQFLYLERVEAGSYRKWDHFYNRTIRLYRRRPRGFLRRYVKGAEHVIDMLTLSRLLKFLRPDIIHFQQAPIPLVDRWFLGGLRRIAPLVSTVHNTTPFHGEASGFLRWGFGDFLSQFDHLIVHTEYSRRQLTGGLGIPGYRISVLPGGLYDHYERLAEPEPTGPTVLQTDSEQNILFFGNISFYKGLDVLIRAFGLLPEERLRKTRLLVCGNPQMPIEPIKSLAQKLGVDDRIAWDLRFIPEEQVHDIFSRSAVVALPYRQIDRSGVLATVIKYGKPVVASRIGGFAEMLEDGVHGYLVDPENPSALAKGLDMILSDPRKACHMGEAVQALAQKWLSWDEIAEEAVRIYEDLQNQQRRVNVRSST